MQDAKGHIEQYCIVGAEPNDRLKDDWPKDVGSCSSGIAADRDDQEEVELDFCKRLDNVLEVELRSNNALLIRLC